MSPTFKKTIQSLDSTKCVYWVAAVISLLLSYWVASRETVINPDAICYLQSAAVVGDGGLRKAMILCPQAQWPLYSVLVYFCSAWFHLSLTTAAYTLNALFSLISVVSFIAITRQLGAKGRALWLAAAVILLAHEFNSVRQYVIRDHGFWAFYLVSIYCLLRYVTVLRWYYALAWGVSLLVATLFRVEGTIFLILLPWTLWFCSSLSYWQRIKGFLQLNLIAALAGLAVFGWLIFHPEISLASLGRMQEFVFQLFHAGGMVWHRFQESAASFAHTSLTSDSMSEATLVFFLLLVVWYIVKVVANLSVIYSALAFYGIWRKTISFTSSTRLVIYGYLFSNLLITSFFLAEHLFLSKRYLIALSLVFMLWVPFTLDKLWLAWQSHKLKTWVFATVALLVLITSLGGIFDFGHSKAYMRQAGEWVEKNVPHSADVYSNDYQVMYYSKHFGNDIFEKIKEYSDSKSVEKGRWKEYDYLVLRASKNEIETGTGLVHEIKMAPIQVFANKRGDQVRIYKIEDE